VHKKSPPEFVLDAANDGEAEAVHEEESAVGPNARSETTDARTPADRPFAGLNAKQLIRVLAVVAVGALSLYLVKRRFR
jgi:hypothetical protein